MYMYCTYIYIYIFMVVPTDRGLFPFISMYIVVSMKKPWHAPKK